MQFNSLPYILLLFIITSVSVEAQEFNCVNRLASIICDPSDVENIRIRILNPTTYVTTPGNAFETGLPNNLSDNACGQAEGFHLDSPLFFTFMATSTSAAIDVNVLSWNVDGLHMIVFTNCSSAEAVGDPINTADCEKEGTVDDKIFRIDNLTIGDVYTVVFDGFGGDYGEFVIRDISGFGTFPQLEDFTSEIEINGSTDDLVCSGSDEITFTIDPSGTEYLQHATYVEWFIKDEVNGSSINTFLEDGNPDNPFSYTFDVPTGRRYEVTVIASDACGNETTPVSKIFTVEAEQAITLTPPYEFCRSWDFDQADLKVEGRADFPCDGVITSASQTSVECIVPDPAGCGQKLILPLVGVSEEVNRRIDTTFCGNAGPSFVQDIRFTESGMAQIPDPDAAPNSCELLEIKVEFLEEIDGEFTVESCPDGTSMINFTPITSVDPADLEYNWVWENDEVFLDDDGVDLDRNTSSSNKKIGTITVEVIQAIPGLPDPCSYFFDQEINPIPSSLNTTPCTSDNGDFSFSWSNIDGASYYVDGELVMGTMHAFEDNLNGGSVDVMLEARFDDCETIVETVTCNSAGCPTFQFDIEQEDDLVICTLFGPSIIQYSTTGITGGDGTGDILWNSSNGGEIDRLTGAFDVEASGPGNYRIRAIYNQNGCRSEPVFRNLIVEEQEEVAFSLDSDACSGTEVTVTFDSNPNISEDDWIITGNHTISSIGGSEWGITWNRPGDYTIAYLVGAGTSCEVESGSQAITIQSSTPTMQITSCTPTMDGATIEWRSENCYETFEVFINGVPTTEAFTEVNEGFYTLTTSGFDPGESLDFEIRASGCFCGDNSAEETCTTLMPGNCTENIEVSCVSSTTSSLDFEWTSPPCYTAYDVMVNGGRPMRQSTNTLELTSLDDLETVQVEVVGIGDCNCIPVEARVSCTTDELLPCAEEIEITCANMTINSVRFEWSSPDCFSEFDVVIDGVSIDVQEDNFIDVMDLDPETMVTIEVGGIGDCACISVPISETCETSMPGACTENIEITCSEITENSIRYEWTGPSCYTEYEVTIDNGIPMVQTDTFIDITGLDLDETQAVNIIVEGVEDCGCIQIPAEETCETLLTVLACTENIEITCSEITENSIRYEWTGPSCYEEYQITIDNGFPTVQTDAFIDITGLDLDESQAVNIIVEGVEDCGCIQIPAEETCESIPAASVCTENIEVTCIGSSTTTVEFEWTSPLCYTEYDVIINGRRPIRLPDNFIDVTGLDPSSEVEIEVMGVEDCGCIQVTASAQCTTEADPNTCTDNIEVTCTGSTTTTVGFGWTAPLCYSEFDVSIDGRSPIRQTDNFIDLSGLDPDSEVEIEVLGVEDCGCIQIAARERCTTEADINTCTDNIEVTCIGSTTTSVEFEWTAPLCYTEYDVIINGRRPIRQTDNFIEVADLDPDSMVEIEVLGVEDCGCRQVAGSESCVTDRDANACSENIEINCIGSTPNSLTFEWTSPLCYSEYEVIVDNEVPMIITETTLELTDLDENQMVNIEVRGVDDCGCNQVTAQESCATDETPGCNVTLDINCGTTSFEDKIELIWEVNTNCFTLFLVYVNGGDPISKLADPSLRNDILIDGLESGTSYDIQIEGIGGGCSCGTDRRYDFMCSTNDGTPCETIDAVCKKRNTSMTLDWSASPCITEFEIYKDGELETITNDFTFSIEDLVQNQEFEFVILGRGDDCGCNIEITEFVPCGTNDAVTETEGNCDNVDLQFTELGEMCVRTDAKPIDLIDYITGISAAGGIARWEGANVVEGKLNIADAPAGTNEIIFSYDQGTCSLERSIIYTKLESPEIERVEVMQPMCPSSFFGSATVDVSGGVMPYRLWVNDEPRDADNLSNLQFPVGQDAIKNVILVADENGCEAQDTIIIERPPFFSASLEGAGTVRFGTTETYELVITEQEDIVIDDIIWEFESDLGEFTTLCDVDCPLTYDLNVESLGFICVSITYNGECADEFCQPILVEDEINMFIPNVMGSGDDENKVFKVFTNDEEAVISTFRIFDRLGNEVFDMGGGVVSPNEVEWDGTFQNDFVESGVYVYHIVMQLVTDEAPVMHTGTVTVIDLR